MKVIIVEGKKDIKALDKLGFKNIVEVKGPLFSFIENIAEKYKECIILTDLDKGGKKLYGILKRGLNKRKVKVDDKFRNFLFKNTKLSNIEGMINYFGFK